MYPADPTSTLRRRLPPAIFFPLDHGVLFLSTGTRFFFPHINDDPQLRRDDRHNPQPSTTTMMFRKILFICASLLSAATTIPLCLAQQQDDAERNIQMGMQGLAQAANDPAVLAQLVRDMQVRTTCDRKNTGVEKPLSLCTRDAVIVVDSRLMMFPRIPK